MTFQSVCDAWRAELQTNVTGLDTGTVPSANVHLYAPYSLEATAAQNGERHLAIWPEGDPDIRIGFLAGSPPSDRITTSYAVLVWEDASAETSRRFDDDTANAAWLALYEAIRARFYELDNVALGQTNTVVHYQGGQLDRQGFNRFLAVRFTVAAIREYT